MTAWLALPGFLAGVGIGRMFERRGYNIGKTHEVPFTIGLMGPLCVGILLLVFVVGGVLAGPGPGDARSPAHAAWLLTLGVGAIAGAVLSATGFCAISAGRQVFGGPRWMLLSAGVLIAAYALVLIIGGKFSLGIEGQPIVHGEWLWNTLGLALVGLCGALCGGCPVRLIVLTGEGNGDAFVGVMGLLVGGALAHTLGLAAKPMTALASGGPAVAGKVAVGVGLVLAIVYAASMAGMFGRRGTST